ncbi:MATE family efflux transporter [[Acholeplasma] multilocale]|uniref:MATE family efflux transporter n=1 Tax=[Acholeplasma] multilocale TaxID=264638 RepID=UPI00068895A9|nr:MATE family efflux transporter [[Acholeplasma] multilocale]
METVTRADKKNKFFASRAWYAAALGIILWSIFQEIIMASTDIVDSMFVNNLSNKQVNGFEDFLNNIKLSGWNQLGSDFLNGFGLGNYAVGESGQLYTSGQIAVNGITASNQMYVIMFAMVSGFCYGAGVYSSQYYGAGDYNKLRQITSIKIYVVFTITLFFAIFAIPGLTRPLISFTTNPHYGNESISDVFAEIGQLTENSTKEQVTRVFNAIQNEVSILSTQEGEHYYQIIAPSYLLLTINQVAITSLRETGRPLYSFWMSLIALTFNVLGNLLLTDAVILGSAAPNLGVRGSAIATVIARSLQTIFIVTLLSIKRFEFIPTTQSFRVQKRIIANTSKKAMPILINELAFAFGAVVMVKMRGTYSVEALTANAIYATVTMAIFSPLYHGMNAGVTALVGNQLGANNLKQAEYNAKHLYGLAIIIGLVFGLSLVALSGVLPSIWHITPEAHRIARWMLLMYGLTYTGLMIANTAYSILRAGGQVWWALAMDSLFNWCVQIPLYLFLVLCNKDVIGDAGLFSLDIVYIFVIVNTAELIKAGLGYSIYRRKKWLVNLTAERDNENTFWGKAAQFFFKHNNRKLNPNMSPREKATVERLDDLIDNTKNNLEEVISSDIPLEEKEHQVEIIEEVIETLEENKVRASEGLRAHKIGRIRRKR